MTDYTPTTQQVEDGFAHEPEYEWAEHKAGNAPDPGPNADYVARAVTEWLNGQGR